MIEEGIVAGTAMVIFLSWSGFLKLTFTFQEAKSHFRTEVVPRLGQFCNVPADCEEAFKKLLVDQPKTLLQRSRHNPTPARATPGTSASSTPASSRPSTPVTSRPPTPQPRSNLPSRPVTPTSALEDLFIDKDNDIDGAGSEEYEDEDNSDGEFLDICPKMA